jgi:hypothetical protein
MTAFLAVAGWFVVHRLTRGREREKLALEFYDSVGEQIDKMKDAALAAWKAPKGPERRRAIAETKWRLQQVGGTLNRLKMLADRRRLQWKWPFKKILTIDMTNEMVALRRAITLDPFEDPARRASKAQAEQVEQEVGAFLSILDARLFDWLR